MATDVIRTGNWGAVPAAYQVNTRNLNAAIKFTTVLGSPLISAFVGPSLGYDSFDNILKKDYEGELLNALEKSDLKALDKFSPSASKKKQKIGSFCRSFRDTVPDLVLTTTATYTSSDTMLNFTANAELLCQKGVNLFNPTTREIMVVNRDATSNTGIFVTRGARGTTAGSILTTDTLLVTGEARDLYTDQGISARPLPQRSTPLVNGFRVLRTPGTSIANTLYEEGLLYDGKFMDLVKNETVRQHKASFLNAMLYEEVGALTYTDATNDLANVNSFNGFSYWARQNSVTAGFQNIGSLTPATFVSLMTWFNVYAGIGDPDNPMIYVCGPTAYNALQTYLQDGILVTHDKGFTPSTVGSRVQKYITSYGKVVYVCVDTYLSQIGRGGDIFMTADKNFSVYIGEDEFLTPPNPAITERGYLEGDARLFQFIPDFSVQNNTRTDVMISYFSMLPEYVELCATATGIVS